jgi:hypothetical protein
MQLRQQAAQFHVLHDDVGSRLLGHQLEAQHLLVLC